MAGNFKLCTWNIDGLDESNIEDRVQSICPMLASLQPDVILLQEVTLPILNKLEILLKSAGYLNMEKARPSVPYFVMILVRNNIVARDYRRFDYTSMDSRSMMCRDITSLKISYSGGDIMIMTSHLESCKESSSRRCSQLIECFEEMRTHDGPVIFGGDLNLRDAEANKVLMSMKGKSFSIIDCWEAMGSDSKHRFTWFLPGNPSVHARFDRVYFNCHNDAKLTSFSLFANQSSAESCIQKLGSSIPLSDHCGVMVEFALIGEIIRQEPSSTTELPPVARKRPNPDDACIGRSCNNNEETVKRSRMLEAALHRKSQSFPSDAGYSLPSMLADEVPSRSSYDSESNDQLICPSGMDSDVFDKLPRDIQEEILHASCEYS